MRNAYLTVISHPTASLNHCRSDSRGKKEGRQAAAGQKNEAMQALISPKCSLFWHYLVLILGCTVFRIGYPKRVVFSVYCRGAKYKHSVEQMASCSKTKHCFAYYLGSMPEHCLNNSQIASCISPFSPPLFTINKYNGSHK